MIRSIVKNYFWTYSAKIYSKSEQLHEKISHSFINPGAPGKIDPRGLHFAHKNVQIDLLYKKFKTWSNRTGLFTIDWQTNNETFYYQIGLFGGDPFDLKRVLARLTNFWLEAARNPLLG